MIEDSLLLERERDRGPTTTRMRIAQPRCHGDARVSVKLVEIMIAHIILGILLLFEGLSKRGTKLQL